MKIIALAGPVGVGKDSLGNIIKDYIKSEYIILRPQILPIAYSLKSDLKDEIKSKYNLDVFSEVRSEKNVFRNDLINYAEEKRSNDASYWVTKWISSAFNILNEHPNTIFIVTDLRHAFKKFDDLQFFKSIGGFVIYIEQYEDINYKNKKILPFRESEHLNDLYLQGYSNFIFRWYRCDTIQDAWENSIDKQNLIKSINKYIYE